jgi:hypothetical protein
LRRKSKIPVLFLVPVGNLESKNTPKLLQVLLVEDEHIIGGAGFKNMVKGVQGM